MSNSKLLIHSYVNSEKSITSPIVGPTGVISIPTPTFDSGYWTRLNSLLVPAAQGASSYAGWTIPLPTAGAFGFWFKPNGWSSASGVPSDGVTHYLVGGYYGADEESDQAGWNYLYLSPGDKIAWDFFDGDITWSRMQVTTADASFDADAWVYISAAWDLTERKIYKNGSEIGSLTNAMTTWPTRNRKVTMGSRMDNSNNEGANGLFQGFRYFNYKKTDWTDRGNPRAGMNDQFSS